ncbi:18505_t:CDS:2, partial [Gigaspora margarita]
ELLLENIKESNDGNVECIELWGMDLSDLHSIKNFDDKFIKKVGELHYLWNNAGTYLYDNFEQQFQVNHLSHFLMTSLLISTIKNSATPESPCKIIHTSSIAQKPGKIDFDNLNGEKSCSLMELYANAKLMVSPDNILKNIIMLFAKSPNIGAINVMYPSLDPNIDEGGKYFEDYKEVKPNDQALNEELTKTFWEKK